MTENIREIVFDTETTGFAYDKGDRVIDIGCIELINHIPSGRTFQVYINPEREIPEEVVKVHGITSEFLADKPKFAEIVDDFLNFIGEDSMLVAHNGTFDMNFINAELNRLNYPLLDMSRLIDTLVLSKKVNPHLSRHSLKALCKHYGVDDSKRTVHGALLDSQLLTDVYLELLGGKEIDFFKKSTEEQHDDNVVKTTVQPIKGEFHESRHFKATDEELEIHDAFMKSFVVDKDKVTQQPYPILWLDDNQEKNSVS